MSQVVCKSDSLPNLYVVYTGRWSTAPGNAYLICNVAKNVTVRRAVARAISTIRKVVLARGELKVPHIMFVADVSRGSKQEIELLDNILKLVERNIQSA